MKNNLNILNKLEHYKLVDNKAFLNNAFFNEVAPTIDKDLYVLNHILSIFEIVKEEKTTSSILDTEEDNEKDTPKMSIVFKPVTYFKHEKDLKTFIFCMKYLVESLSRLSTKGYLNKPDINLYGLESFLSSLDLLKNQDSLKSSLLLNTTYFNMILLGLYISIKLIEESQAQTLDEDSLIDLKVLKGNIFKMINPLIREKLLNKSVSLYLNGFLGFDTEYELESSAEIKNRLLSIQLASSNNYYIKIPNLEQKPLSHLELKTDSPGGWGSDIGIKIFTSVIDDLVSFYKEKFHKLYLKCIERMHDYYQIKKVFGNDDFNLYYISNSKESTKIRYFEQDNEKGYSFMDLLKDSELMTEKENELNLIKTLKELELNIHPDISSKNNQVFQELNIKEESKILDSLKTLDVKEKVQKILEKPSTRISYGLGESSSKLSININKTLYITMHETAADLSMLKDFTSYKELFNIVGRSFVTHGKPLEFKELLQEEDDDLKYLIKSKVHFRDTALIAPAGVKSLADIGKIYGDSFKKIEIGDFRTGKMSDLLKENKSLFEEYGLQDARITLKHALEMEKFNTSLGKIGIPLTMSGIGKSYVEREWQTLKYKGYQLNSFLLIGELGTSLTPKNTRAIDFSKYIVSFISTYRGGRNETFIYGIDEGNAWFDYDLTSCYTTVMTLLGHPDFDSSQRVLKEKIESMTDEELIFNYLSLNVTFKFCKKIKYPCIPTRVDDDSDVYPLKGQSVITGLEYLAAKKMGCKIHVLDGVLVPFKRSITKSKKSKKSKGKDTESTEQQWNLNYLTPFRTIVTNLQAERRKHVKKSFYNLMYKEIGNSIYGQIAMGLGGKRKFDVKTLSFARVPSNFLTNPLLASYITGFTRALIGECLYNINVLGGVVVSVTTDGFITNIEDLETKILNSDKTLKTFITLYKQVRKLLTIKQNEESKTISNPIKDASVLIEIDKNLVDFNDSALEVKTVEEKGLITWKTRGQIGKSGNLIATTGFQARSLPREFLYKHFKEIINDPNSTKQFNFIQSRLLSATDVFNKDCQVMMVYADRKFNLEYDDKRSIIEKPIIFKNVNIENSKGLLFYDSRPWNDVEEYGHIRYMKKLVTNPVYKKGFVTVGNNKYKDYLETSVRGFICACVSLNNRHGIPENLFCSYKEIKEFIKRFEPATRLKISLSMISKLKNRETIPRAVPRTIENEEFVRFVKEQIPTFDDENFFRELSPESIKKLKELRKLTLEVKANVLNNTSLDLVKLDN